ncbi:MAG: C45 family autoproteolytic acyltransferase/hydrolase, partial [Candidatus Hodarchaeota archaeon]
MSEKYNLISGKFQHIVMEGSSYDIGRMQGEILKKNENLVPWFKIKVKNLNIKKKGLKDFRELQMYFDDYCPGINDEIQGFADVYEVPVEKIAFYSDSYSVPKKCSQILVLSSVTEDNHIYVGRSYEWKPDDEDLWLCTTRAKGKAAHIGFSQFLFGRNEGFNEHGLCVSMTGAGIFGVPTKKKGLMFWAIIRSLLDQCTTVDEALKLIETMPIAEFFTLLLVDRHGSAALIEIADGTKGIRYITNDAPEKFLFSTNHFNLPETVEYNKLNVGIFNQSRRRSALIESTLEEAAPKISKSTIRDILSGKFPDGVCDHYYSYEFGTVWSMLADVSTGAIDICFGA